MGDVVNSSAWMSTVGNKVYSICDSNFPENIFKLNTTYEGCTDRCRIPLTDPSKLRTNSLVSADWLSEVDEAVERGAVKKADTIEELADMLLLDRQVLVDAIKNWNRICEQGVDDELAVPYDLTWLNPVADPPFYAAIVGGQMGKTMCGLRVNEKLQVLNEEGVEIPGLWANYTTAGGLAGECDDGCFVYSSSPFGGMAMSWFTGYIAAKELMKLEM
jgi:fumarate reductase flavoprotein subunit